MSSRELPADDAGLEALLRDERNGPPLPGDVTPWDFVVCWPDTVVRERVWPIVSKLMVDADEVVRARAVELVRGWDAGRELTTPRLVEVAQQHPELYGDQVVESIALRDSMGHALGNVASEVGAPVANLLREMCALGPVGGAGSVLGRFDPDFVIEKVPVWGDACESFVADAAGSLALYRRDSVIAFLDAARGLSRAIREQLLETVEHGIERDDAIAAQLATSVGFPPPAKPAPTAEDCRRALALDRSAALAELLHQLEDPSDIPWNDEMYDVPRANDLETAERATYVARLIANARQGDPRAILTLGALDANEALPMLAADAHGAQPWAQTARRALVRMGHGNDIVDAVVDDARHGPTKMARVAAILDLATIGGATALDALEAALEDPEYEVRLLAWDGLVAALDLGRHLVNDDGVRELTTDLERMRILLGSDKLVAFVKLGAAGVRELAQQVRAGASPRSLDIQWTPKPSPELFQTLRLALIDETRPFPTGELAALHGFARRQAETLVALRLEDNDPRAPEALVALGAAWTVAALDEVAANPDAPAAFRDLCTRCARSLRAS